MPKSLKSIYESFEGEGEGQAPTLLLNPLSRQAETQGSRPSKTPECPETELLNLKSEVEQRGGLGV